MFEKDTIFKKLDVRSLFQFLFYLCFGMTTETFFFVNREYLSARYININIHNILSDKSQ